MFFFFFSDTSIFYDLNNDILTYGYMVYMVYGIYGYMDFTIYSNDIWYMCIDILYR